MGSIPEMYLTDVNGNAHDVQIRAFNSDKRFIALVAGRRSRKTMIAKRKVLINSLRDTGYHFHMAPTNKQARKIFWKDLQSYTREIRSDMSKQNVNITLHNGSIIEIEGMDNYDRLEGITNPEIKTLHVTEIKAAKDGILDILMPLVADTGGKIILDSSARKNQWYEIIYDATGGNVPDFGKPGGDYFENENWGIYGWPTSDVLSTDQLSIVRMGMDEKRARIEFDVSFEGMDGLAYYNFTEKNIRPCMKMRKDIHIGMDFNVDFMSAALFHLYDGYVEQFGEIRLGKNGNTDEMIRAIKIRFPNDKITVYPDAAGNQRQANAAKFTTSIRKLRDNFTVVVNKTNPYQSDRVEMVNGLCKDYHGKIRYFVDPSCEYTIRDRQRVEMDANGSLRTSVDIGHMSDASDYFLCKIYNRLINREKKSMDMKISLNKIGW